MKVTGRHACVRLASTSWHQVTETEVGLRTFTKWNIIVCTPTCALSAIRGIHTFHSISEVFQNLSFPPGDTLRSSVQNGYLADKFSLLFMKNCKAFQIAYWCQILPSLFCIIPQRFLFSLNSTINMCGSCSSNTIWKVFIGDSVSTKILQDKKLLKLIGCYITISVHVIYTCSTSFRSAYLNKI